MHKIVQENKDNKGRVQVYADSFILTETFGSVKYLSMFGTTGAVKSIAAQIISNRDSIHIIDETGKHVLQDGYKPLELNRGNDWLRNYTRCVKPGVTHKILYSVDYFIPWKKMEVSEFITFGPTDQDARKRAFQIVDKLGNVPLKETWIDWLWEKLMEDNFTPTPIVGGAIPEIANSAIVSVPGDTWLEACIMRDLEKLKTL